MFKIFKTEQFEKRFNELDKSVQLQIEKEIDQLEVNPYAGKPLGYRFFREKKCKGFRFYYLIYEEYVVVFIITISDKKDQREIINTIKSLMPFYKEEIKKKLKL
ncbi:type II toxin-antitoxin system RelE/ParE family toxin [Candidatus Woesearchaeota archaeon]|nr:type II toxin-antitoxin system RelE/ParE family toxin [Candidatus Woesearchaeota archaeon]